MRRGGVPLSKKPPPSAPPCRRQTVELVRAGRTPGELAREFEGRASAIRNRVRQADRDEVVVKRFRRTGTGTIELQPDSRNPGARSRAAQMALPADQGHTHATVPDGNEGPGWGSPRAVGPIGCLNGARRTPRGHERGRSCQPGADERPAWDGPGPDHRLVEGVSGSQYAATLTPRVRNGS